MEHQSALLLGRLGRNEPHIGPSDCLADRLSICSIVLLPFDVRFSTYAGGIRRHSMAKRFELARPMMRRGASLNADKACWQLLEECQDVATLQLAADNHLATGINAVDLKYRLRDVETNCRNRLHGVAPPNRGSLNSAHIHGTHVPGGVAAVHSINTGHEGGRSARRFRANNDSLQRRKSMSLCTGRHQLNTSQTIIKGRDILARVAADFMPVRGK